MSSFDREGGRERTSHDRAGGVEQLAKELVHVPGTRLEESERRGDGSYEWLAAHLRAWERHRVKFGVTWWPIRHARVFRAGCIEPGPDGLPPSATMRRYAGEVPQGFTFTVMMSDDVLVYRFPYGYPDRARRGELNPSFLEPGPLLERTCTALDALDGTLDTVVLRMQPVYRTEELRASEFVGRLERFLGGLPRAYRYAVDLRTPAFNVPEYRACLRDHGVAHLLHHTPQSCPPLPDASSLIDQLLIPGTISAPFCVAHVHTGLRYDHDPDPDHDDADDHDMLALGVHHLIRACGDEGTSLTVLIDSGWDCGDMNPGDGSTLAVLTHLLHSLDGELARRSPLRRRAA